MNSTTRKGSTPQVGRNFSESHTGRRLVCLMDSGGDTYSNCSKNLVIKSKKKKCVQKLKIVSRNVKTLLDSTSTKSITTPRTTAIVAKELNSYNIDLAAIQETHLKENGQLIVAWDAACS